MKRALIFGVTGQDGSYLAEKLLSKGYTVVGARRRSSSFNTQRIDHLIHDHSMRENSNFELIHADLLDSSSILQSILTVKPDEIFNLAGQSHVAVSFETPDYTSQTTGLAVLRILEAIRLYREIDKKGNPKFYQASSSEMFGNTMGEIQNEETPMRPVSPYGSAKLYAHDMVKIYREGFGIHASSGILFNHESPRRGETFVSRKITRGAARIMLGLQQSLVLGNLDSRRDWGHASEYVDGIISIINHESPDDFVVATGVSNTVRELVELAFKAVGIDLVFEGHGLNEVGINKESGQKIIYVSEKYFRPVELNNLCGDASKVRRLLGWKPNLGFEDIVNEMVEADIQALVKHNP